MIYSIISEFLKTLKVQKLRYNQVLCLITCHTCAEGRPINMFEYNGSAVVAMSGDNCVAIAADTRLGINRFQTVSKNFQKIYRTTKKSFMGLAGLATDIQTIERYMKFRLNLYRIDEDREIPVRTLGDFMGHVLYSRRFSPWFAQPIICGLDEKDEPYLSQYDSIGSYSALSDFAVCGSASHQLYGVCEGLYEKHMDPDSLVDCISNSLVAAIERDCVSGWGAVVHLITPEKIETLELKTRLD